MTIDDAKTLRHGERLHYTGRHDCSRTVGPRGGITQNITEVRVSGAVKTWKTDTGRIRVPVKYGLYESAAIESHNVEHFHRAAGCPLDNKSIDDTDEVEEFYATRYPNLSQRYKLGDLHADTQDRIRAEYDRAQLAGR